jgi:hypothetical protein
LRRRRITPTIIKSVDPIPEPPTGTVSGLVINCTQTGGATAGLPNTTGGGAVPQLPN